MESEKSTSFKGKTKQFFLVLSINSVYFDTILSKQNVISSVILLLQ